ncbi:hypothetical protein [Hamadaea sp.]|uniref:hypothetical protein n=1 Tax=Hamadaea sp. TaxID=2024425 RepID=UPI0025BC68BA|nr:hypothetical protein [Hamadaea sp.]
MISVAEPANRAASGESEILDPLLWQDAQLMLARHAPRDGIGTDDDTCAWCGLQWPCPPRRLAERAAAASTRTWQHAWTARHDLNSLRSLPSVRSQSGGRNSGSLLGLDAPGADEVGRAGTNRALFD